MIFEILEESAKRGELILVDGGICNFHIRRDGQLTIREIIVLPEYLGQGIGSSILSRLIAMKPKSIFAKCPSDLSSNGWYEHMGFILEGTETTKRGRKLNLWRLAL